MDADLNDPSRRHWERQCIERARSGDTDAFGELYDVYAERLYQRVLWPLLGNRAAAEDALAETFRAAYQRLATFEVQEVSIFHWLARIAKNKALDMHRARKVTGRALANFETLLGPLQPPHASPEELLDHEVSQDRLARAVQRTLAELNERYRQAIVLRFLEDRSREQCAELLGVKLGTFDVLLLRALRAFRKRWEERASVPPAAREATSP